MVDYNFLNNGKEMEVGRVEFFNADLPEFSGVTRAVLIRKKTDEGLKKIEAMRGEMRALRDYLEERAINEVGPVGFLS